MIMILIMIMLMITIMVMVTVTITVMLAVAIAVMMIIIMRKRSLCQKQSCNLVEHRSRQFSATCGEFNRAVYSCMSSAYLWNSTQKLSIRHPIRAMNAVNKMGVRTDPCGMPILTGIAGNRDALTQMWNVLSDRCDTFQSSGAPLIPNSILILSIRILTYIQSVSLATLTV